MAKIFISYKRVDKDKVFRIKDKIEVALGEKCWIDLDGIESDAQFANIIIRAINNAEIILFMYSKAHVQINDHSNDWTIRELTFANNRGKRIIFLNIDKAPLTDWFNLMFGTKQQIDATSEIAVNKLIQDLRQWLSPSITNEPKQSITEKKHKSSQWHNLSRMCRKYILFVGVVISIIMVIMLIHYGTNTSKVHDTSTDKFFEIASEEIFEKGKEAYDNENCEEAVTYFKEAAEQGYAKAQFYFGACYLDGCGIEQDLTEAIKWWQKAATQGDAKAQFNLGFCYKIGYGVEQDLAKAIQWLQKATEQGDAAQRDIALGGGALDYDTETINHYQRSAKFGNPEAQFYLGLMELNSKDDTEAVMWFHKAAELGHGEAQIYLALSYYYGIGVELDYFQTVKWLEKYMKIHVDEQMDIMRKFLDP